MVYFFYVTAQQGNYRLAGNASGNATASESLLWCSKSPPRESESKSRPDAHHKLIHDATIQHDDAASGTDDLLNFSVHHSRQVLHLNAKTPPWI